MYELVFKFTIINLTYVHVKDFAEAFLTLKFVAMYLKLDRLLLQYMFALLATFTF